MHDLVPFESQDLTFTFFSLTILRQNPLQKKAIPVFSGQKPGTVKPRFNEPLFNVVLDITNEILRPGQSCSKMDGIKPRYNEPRYNEHIPEA